MLVRSPAAKAELERYGIKDEVVIDERTNMEAVGERAVALKANGVFDGIGGGELSRLLPHVPQQSTVYAYGFLTGLEPVHFPSILLVGKDLTLRRWSGRCRTFRWWWTTRCSTPASDGLPL